MGGRGSVSASARQQQSTIPYNHGASSDSRADVLEMFNLAGIDDVYGLDDVPPAVAAAYAIQLQNLEHQYHAIEDLKGNLEDGFTFSMGDLGPGVRGVAEYYYRGNKAHFGDIEGINAAIRLDKKYATDIKTRKWEADFQTASGKRIDTNANPHANKDLLSRVRYTVTHEYGHQLQYALYARARANGYKGTQGQYAKKVRTEINRLAGLPANDGPTEYGRSKGTEFFAETFAGANLGGTDKHSVAMREWLRREGVI